jgi:hypothetical protein
LIKRQKRLIEMGRKKGFNYSLYGIWPSNYLKFIDSGLLLLSKYPIISFSHYLYQSATEIDQFAAKQIIRATLEIDGKRIHVFTTHMQATYGNNECGSPQSGNAFYEWGQTLIKGGVRPACDVVKECNDARLGQVQEMRNFISSQLANGEKLGSNEIALLLGDLNIDARDNDASGEYAKAMKILSQNALFEVSNVYEQVHGYHPITYGDINEKGEHKETVLTATMDRGTQMCLDYIFLFKRSKEQTPVNFRVEKIRLEPFFLSSPIDVPVTQLSDHYGLSMDLLLLNE